MMLMRRMRSGREITAKPSNSNLRSTEYYVITKYGPEMHDATLFISHHTLSTNDTEHILAASRITRYGVLP
jgi:hypothetical protein